MHFPWRPVNYSLAAENNYGRRCLGPHR